MSEIISLSKSKQTDSGALEHKPPEFAFEPINRREIVARLRGALNTKDVCISTCAGYGKTVCCAQLFDALEIDGDEPRWLTITPSINSRTRFSTALHSILSLVPSKRSLITDLQSDATCLIIDQLERLTDPDALNLIEELLRNPARTFRLVLIFSARPSISTTDLIFSETLSSFDETAFTCSLDETRELLSAFHLEHASADVALNIHRFCEGWIAGIKALLIEQAASISEGAPVQHVLPKAVRDFFYETSYSKLTEEHRSALVKSSVADRISPSLFSHLTGHNGLLDLLRKNTFLNAIQGAPNWFRFHRLYLIFLRERGSGLGVRETRALHRQTAEWHIKTGSVTEAADHAVASGDREYAVEVINEAARMFIANGQISRALGWLEQLGDIRIEEHPLIGLYYVTALTLSGRFEDAQTEHNRLVTICQEHVERGNQPEWLSVVNQQNKFHVELLAFWQRTYSPLDREPTIVPSDSENKARWLIGERLWLRGMRSYNAGDFYTADKLLRDAAPHLKRTASWYAYASAQAVRARIERSKGELSSALKRCYLTISEITEMADQDVPVNAILRITAAEIEYDFGQWTNAASTVAAASDKLKELKGAEWTLRAGLVRARLHERHGQYDLALDELHEVRSLIDHPGLEEFKAAYIALQTRIYLGAGRVQDARDGLGTDVFMHRFPEQRPSEAARAKFAMSLANARVLIAEGDDANAQSRLSQMLAFCERVKDVVGQVKCHLLIALAQLEAEAENAAMRSTRDALILSQKTGQISDLRRPSATKLLGMFVHQHSAQERSEDSPIDAQFLAVLVDDSDFAPVRLTRSSISAANDTPLLTAKEREILSLVESGYSNADIAGEIFVSVGTVKWHMGNILSKLDAPNRTTAVKRARELNIDLDN